MKMDIDFTDISTYKIISSDTNPVTVGDKYKNYPAKVCEIFYTPKSWWQFWKRKQQIGYMVRWD